MKYTTVLLSLSLFVSVGFFPGQAPADEAREKSQTISRAGSQPSVKGSGEYFTGPVRIDPLFHEIIFVVINLPGDGEVH